MATQKIENLLLSAFDATTDQREKSPELSASYDEATQKWEVAVRYINELESIIREFRDIEVEYLIGNYAILRGEKEDLLEIATRDEVLFMEAAKRLFFSETMPTYALKIEQLGASQISGLDSICITRTFLEDENIYGQGVYTAYLDSGIDYRHPQFFAEDGKSRIAFIWDQTREDGFYDAEQIQAAIDLPEEQGERLVPQRDLSGHGTHVAAIGSGRDGVAPKSQILVVKLGTSNAGGAKTTQLMRGVDACVRFAIKNNKPLALNISYGTNYGSHNGNGLLENYLETAMGYGRNIFVVGAGNEGVGTSHYRVRVGDIRERKKLQSATDSGAYEVEFSVGEFQASFSLQIWKHYQDVINIYIRPAGVSQPIVIQKENAAITYDLSGMQMLVFYGEPSPLSVYQEIYIDFIPQDRYLPAGIWKIYLETIEAVEEGVDNPDQRYIDMWLPVQEGLEKGTGFLRPVPETTLTIPATAMGVLTVGAYDQRFEQAASFSGRGYTWALNLVKPDVVAPGVDIVSASVGGGYTRRSGTSMATPFVTGASALFLEWGIVRGKDSYLYGEKIKAYFIKGARRLSGIIEYPNPLIGWGALCIEESIPR